MSVAGRIDDLSATLPSGAVAEFHSFVADVEDLIKATTTLTGADLAEAKAKLDDRISAARGTVAEMTDAVAAKGRVAARAADGFVHEHPWQAIGIGAAVGLLVGFVLARRQ